VDWPVNHNAENRKRYKRLLKLNSDPQLRAAVMSYYKTHPADWITDWCVTFDPRNTAPQPRIMPFVLFPRQREFIEFLHGCLQDKQSGLVEKCRDVGASYLSIAFSLWLFLFHPGTAIGWGSRKEEYVDKKGDPKALFPKIRQMMERLPKWMMPEGFDPRLHSTHMKIINPANGSTIVGEAGESQGRGGRTTIYFKDESAWYEHPELIEAALGDNTDVQIDISSVNGTGNVFYRRRMAGEVWTPGCTIPRGKTRVFIFDWRDHPAKNQAWYDERRIKAESEALLHLFAQEVDRDYSGAVQGVIIPQPWVQAAIDAHIKLGFAPEGKKFAMQDVADGGGDKNALVIRHGVVCTYADHWGGEAGEAAKVAVPICNEQAVAELYYDPIGVGAGFKTQVNTMMSSVAWNRRLNVFPWNAGAPPLDPDRPSIPGDSRSVLNKDAYKNLKAQSWFRARARFYKTYRAVIHGETFPHDELISISSKISRLHELCLELSQPVRKDTGDGKTVVDKKPDGATSPNLADSFIAVYNPVRKISILEAL
jgi:phage terminase large subunit